MKKLLLQSLTILFLFCLCSLQGQDPFIKSQPSFCGGGCTDLWLENAPAPDTGYNYFWFFDDGTYSFSKSIDDHQFQTTGNHDVYLEVIKRYDDDDEPESYTANVPTTGSSDETETVSQKVSILTSRMPRSGDTITYIFTYGDICPPTGGPTAPSPFLDIIYNSSQLDYVKTSVYHGENVPGSFSPGAIPISNLKIDAVDNDLAKRIFVRFEVTENVEVGDIVEVGAKLSYDGAAPPGCDFSAASSLGAVKSHDPNYIIGNRSKFCGGAAPWDSVTYSIHFQNIGEAPAQTVEVRTYLPIYFRNDTIESNFPFEIRANREIVWTLNAGVDTIPPDGLRGTGEADFPFGAFPIEDTRDTIWYKVYFSDDNTVRELIAEPCRSIINQAEIVFDCNPSIFTNFYTTEIVCDTARMGNLCACDRTILREMPPVKISSLLTEGLNLGSSQMDAVWYPGVSLGDQFAAITSASPTKGITYVSSVKGSRCTQQIVIQPVDMECDLDINLSSTLKGCDTDSLVDYGIISAQAITTGDTSNLVWNWECTDDVPWTKTGYKLVLDSLTPGSYYLTVKDTMTGCWTDARIVIPSVCPGGATSSNNTILALLLAGGSVVLLGFGARARSRRKNKANN